MKEVDITEEVRFQNCGGQLIADLIGGSKLYGLDTPTSDTDFRGVFIAGHPHYKSGLKKIESIVQLQEESARDAAYYELRHFLLLLAKTNTQILEMLFAPESAFTVKEPIFDEIRAARFSLIDSERLKKSLIGYIFSELRLANGERVGRLGSSRKEAINLYQYSPKNFVQILRLIYVGQLFFEEGVYPVNIKEFNPELHQYLLDIKTNPANFSKEQLNADVEKAKERLESVIEKSKIKFEFDMDLASELILKHERSNQNQEGRSE